MDKMLKASLDWINVIAFPKSGFVHPNDENKVKCAARALDKMGIPMSPSVKLNGRPINVPTYHNVGYVFAPYEVLCDLPTARSYDDIDSVCHYNDMFRRRICNAISARRLMFTLPLFLGALSAKVAWMPSIAMITIVRR